MKYFYYIFSCIFVSSSASPILPTGVEVYYRDSVRYIAIINTLNELTVCSHSRFRRQNWRINWRINYRHSFSMLCSIGQIIFVNNIYIHTLRIFIILYNFYCDKWQQPASIEKYLKSDFLEALFLLCLIYIGINSYAIYDDFPLSLESVIVNYYILKFRIMLMSMFMFCLYSAFVAALFHYSIWNDVDLGDYMQPALIWLALYCFFELYAFVLIKLEENKRLDKVYFYYQHHIILVCIALILCTIMLSKINIDTERRVQFNDIFSVNFPSFLILGISLYNIFYYVYTSFVILAFFLYSIYQLFILIIRLKCFILLVIFSLALPRESQFTLLIISIVGISCIAILIVIKTYTSVLLSINILNLWIFYYCDDGVYCHRFLAFATLIPIYNGNVNLLQFFVNTIILCKIKPLIVINYAALGELNKIKYMADMVNNSKCKKLLQGMQQAQDEEYNTVSMKLRLFQRDLEKLLSEGMEASKWISEPEDSVTEEILIIFTEEPKDKVYKQKRSVNLPLLKQILEEQMKIIKEKEPICEEMEDEECEVTSIECEVTSTKWLSLTQVLEELGKQKNLTSDLNELKESLEAILPYVQDKEAYKSKIMSFYKEFKALMKIVRELPQKIKSFTELNDAIKSAMKLECKWELLHEVLKDRGDDNTLCRIIATNRYYALNDIFDLEEFRKECALINDIKTFFNRYKPVLTALNCLNELTIFVLLLCTYNIDENIYNEIMEAIEGCRMETPEAIENLEKSLEDHNLGALMPVDNPLEKYLRKIYPKAEKDLREIIDHIFSLISIN